MNNDSEKTYNTTPCESNIESKHRISDEPVLQWRCHPALKRPWITLSVTLFLLLVSLVVFYLTDSKTFTTLALVIMFASLAKFYFPTSYKLDNKRVTIKTSTQTLHKEWSLFRSFYPDKNGILLSPFTSPTRLENFRGLYIMFNDNRDEVIDFVRMKITPPSNSSSNRVQ